MKTKALLFGLIFFACQSPSTIKNSSQKQRVTTKPDFGIALEFINDYVKHLIRSRGENSIIEWVDKQPSVTVEFKKKLKKVINEAKVQSPENGLGFDPILNAQDFPDKGFEIDEMDSISGYLTVFGKDWKTFKLRMKIKLKNNQWLVDGAGVINIPENMRLQYPVADY